jgi:signal transduction histidine kinase
MKVAPGSRLNRQLALRIVLFSSMVTVVTTLLQLWADYRADVGQLSAQQTYIATSYSETIEKSVWMLNKELVQSQVDGIARLPGISHVSVAAKTGQIWVSGSSAGKHVLGTHIVLRHQYLDDKLVEVGRLDIESDLWPVYRSLLSKAAEILLFNGVKTFIVAAFILLLVRRLVTDPLARIAEHFEGRPEETLHLFRRRAWGSGGFDEIDQLAAQLSGSYRRLHESLERMGKSERQLAAALTDRERLLHLETGFKQRLEREVIERTQELEQTLERLRGTQDLLIERERLAGLGRMLGGLAQAMDRPLEQGLETVDQLVRQGQALRDRMVRGSEGEALARQLEQDAGLLRARLQHAADLIGGIRRATHDQGHEPIEHLQLAGLIGEVVEHFRPALEAGRHLLEVNCPASLWLDGYPAALRLVLRHLLANAIEHGCAGREGGSIEISARLVDEREVEIKVADFGKGIDASLHSRIFDPFFSSQLGREGAGLGLFIVQKLVREQMGGSVQLQSLPGLGATFVLRFARQLETRARH